MDQPSPEQALRRLEPLVGEWTLEARWPDGEPWSGGGRVTFEWHPSGAHLLERGTVELPDAPDNVSIILWREGEPFPQRFTSTVSDDGNTFSGRWEIAEDGTNYRTDFDLTYRRVVA